LSTETSISWLRYLVFCACLMKSILQRCALVLKVS